MQRRCVMTRQKKLKFLDGGARELEQLVRCARTYTYRRITRIYRSIAASIAARRINPSPLRFS